MTYRVQKNLFGWHILMRILLILASSTHLLKQRKKGRNLFFCSSGGQKSEIKFVSKTVFQLVILGENLPLPNSVAVDIPCLTTTSLQLKWLPWLLCLLFLFLCVFLIRIFAIYLEPTWTHQDEPLNSKYLVWLHLKISFFFFNI